MTKGLIGQKLGMTSMFSPDGRRIPVTVLKIGPCVVTQIKNKIKEGYDSIQVGFGEKKLSRINKPDLGHLKKSGEKNLAVLKEFSTKEPENFKLGQVINVIDVFKIGETVNVSGLSKGRGFAGVMKRHGFHGGPKTHGGMCQRIPGSIGSSAWPSRVVKGKRLPGHYGNARTTVKNLQIVDIRSEDNVLLLKGAVPGPNKGYIEVNKQKLP
jgi:large subunit ribosomal protein L3